MGPGVPLWWASTHPPVISTAYSQLVSPVSLTCVPYTMCHVHSNVWHLHTHTCRRALSVSLIFTPTPAGLHSLSSVCRLCR